MHRNQTVIVECQGLAEMGFMVVSFTSRDSSILSTLGSHSKENRWKIGMGLNSSTFDIVLTVDKSVMKSEPQVSIDWDGKKIFPEPGSTTYSKAKLKEDFMWKLPFRGVLPGVNKEGFYEVRNEQFEKWYPATLTEQRQDGLFKATVQVPDDTVNDGYREVQYPAVRKENIREAWGVKNPIAMPQRFLVLHVPKSDPMHASLSVDTGDRMTYFFARRTPRLTMPPGTPKSTSTGTTVNARHALEAVVPVNYTDNAINFKVSKDRSRVSTDVGHSVLSHFLEGDIRSVEEKKEKKLKHSWTIQIGPFAEHTIELEKKYSIGKMVSLTVDGDLLVESNAEDIESREGYWECAFYFIGEKYLNWEVYESNAHGYTLDTVGTINQLIRRYQHKCEISFRESGTLVDATLTIDGVRYQELALRSELFREEPISCSPEAMQATYSLVTPFKVSDSATTTAASTVAGAFGFFTFCCQPESHLGPSEEMHFPQYH